MEQLKRFTVAFVLIAALLLSSVGCNRATLDPKQEETPMPKATIPAVNINPSDDVTMTNLEINEVDPPKQAAIAGGVYTLPENIEELFAVTECVVFGEVIKVREYEDIMTYSDGHTSNVYYSVIEFKVSKSYGGDKKLNSKTLQVRYEPCAHRNFGERYPVIEEGKKYFFFLYETARHFKKACYKKRVEMCPYSLTPTMESVAESVGDGYNGAVLDALMNGTYDPYVTEKRLVKSCSMKHIENIINDNIKNMKGMTLIEFWIQSQSQS